MRARTKRLPHPPDGAIVLWVLYDHPKDFPSEWVLRRWFVYQGRTEVEIDCIHGSDRDLVSGMIPAAAIQIGPSKFDDPVIAEVWT